MLIPKRPVNEEGRRLLGERAPPQQRWIGGNHCALLIEFEFDKPYFTPAGSPRKGQTLRKRSTLTIRERCNAIERNSRAV